MLFFSGNLFYIVLYDSQCGKDISIIAFHYTVTQNITLYNSLLAQE